MGTPQTASLSGAATILAATLAAAPALLASTDLGSEQQRADGKRLYDKYCAQCHGDTGDGQGYATPRVKPEPRDFTSGKYKFRSTPSGTLPTDDDLRRAIRLGLPYTSMPGWPAFTDQQVQNLVYYLKTFGGGFENPERHAPPISIGKPLESTEESIERGKVLYVEQGCAACHGEGGRGNGLSAPTLVDDWGDHIRPIDLTQRWTFRGGPTKADIFRTFSTGLNGTPMPSYADVLEDEDRWHLVNYIYSLGDGDDPGYASLVVARFLEDEIELERGEELFAEAAPARFPLVGQILEIGRNFYPSTTSIVVQAVYNTREIAFLLRWNDMRADTGGHNDPSLEVPHWDQDNPSAAAPTEAAEDDFWGGAEAASDDDFFGGLEEPAQEDGFDDFFGEALGAPATATGASEFSDAVALQLPQVLPTGIRKPYFLFGDSTAAVDLWFVDLARAAGDAVPVRQLVGRGSADLEPVVGDRFEARASYVDGEWRLLIKRPLDAISGVDFRQDLFVPIAFSVWDGFNRERGNKRAVSQWFYVYAEPREMPSPVRPMVTAALAVLAVELLVIFAVRRRTRARGRQLAGAAAGAR
ncbi:MAG TPA: c-type cytochrome [Thermoanaerobaculia bacterium]|nr:c-type cytochrome [Thermoanaerobaculia bacterium]